MLFDEFSSCFRLEGGKPEDVVFIPPDDKDNSAITEITNTVKKNDFFIYSHIVK